MKFLDLSQILTPASDFGRAGENVQDKEGTIKCPFRQINEILRKSTPKIYQFESHTEFQQKVLPLKNNLKKILKHLNTVKAHITDLYDT